MTSNQSRKRDATARPSDVIAKYDEYVMPIAKGYEPFAERGAEELERVARVGADHPLEIGTHTSTDLAAVVLEPVMVGGRIVVPPADSLERVTEIAHDLPPGAFTAPAEIADAFEDAAG